MNTLGDMNQRISTRRAPLRQFSVPLSATRRGARLARLLAAEKLLAWELPLDPARLIVAELATNAALHGRVPGRSFRLALSVVPPRTLRIELTDTRGDRLPVSPRTTVAAHAESGYGLLLVEELADRWGVRCAPVPSKTVWAELDLGAAPSVSGHETSHRIAK
ncbi:ATP-binding protein [Streptomyces sp. PU10]|uniref:ATP-binding protein n=1 Tax=unclassified Streptomyces TaxID=2593676 RepID=UPI0028FC5F21|nr:ATP-binding protein [Streptomyces sp. PU10]MDU0255392.1 ATP-binding protein [Streptomyces sp. PU10]WSU02170.1 ATP-binding protein [Streptomyces sp. NBC_01124]